MLGFVSQLAKAVARVFAPATPGWVPVGYQPITDDVYRPRGSACYASELDIIE